MDTAASPPCYRRHGFLSHVGEGFMSGTVVGSALFSIVGYCSAPAGKRLARAARGALVKGPRGAGFFGAYSALYYVFEGAMVRKRGKQDCWNSAAAGAVAFGLIHMPLFGRGAVVHALCGAAIGPLTSTFDTEPPLGFISIDYTKKGY